MENRLRTGIDVLDRKLNGGIPSGSIVALCARPASQAELFLYELTATRGALYLSLDRTGDAVTHSIREADARTQFQTVLDLPKKEFFDDRYGDEAETLLDEMG